MEIENTELADRFTNSHKKDFDCFFEQVVKKEKKLIEENLKIYQEYYSNNPLKQEEDTEYIQSLKKLSKRNSQ